MLREMLSFYFESDKRKRYWHPINASETSKHAGLHLTFCSSVQSQRRPSRPAHLGVPDTEPSHPPPGPLVPSSGQVWQRSHPPPRLLGLQGAPSCSGYQSVGELKGAAGLGERAGKSSPATLLHFWLSCHQKTLVSPLPKGVTAAEKAQGKQIKHNASPSGFSLLRLPRALNQDSGRMCGDRKKPNYGRWTHRVNAHTPYR